VSEGAVPPIVGAGLDKLLRCGTLAGNWRIDSAWPNEDGSGVRVAFVGPRGLAATLLLHAPAPGRIAGKWEFQPGQEAAQRSLAMAVAALLRPSAHTAAASRAEPG
jgi:hypothetical protein